VAYPTPRELFFSGPFGKAVSCGMGGSKWGELTSISNSAEYTVASVLGNNATAVIKMAYGAGTLIVMNNPAMISSENTEILPNTEIETDTEKFLANMFSLAPLRKKIIASSPTEYSTTVNGTCNQNDKPLLGHLACINGVWAYVPYAENENSFLPTWALGIVVGIAIFIVVAAVVVGHSIWKQNQLLRPRFKKFKNEQEGNAVMQEREENEESKSNKTEDDLEA